MTVCRVRVLYLDPCDSSRRSERRGIVHQRPSRLGTAAVYNELTDA